MKRTRAVSFLVLGVLGVLGVTSSVVLQGALAQPVPTPTPVPLKLPRRALPLPAPGGPNDKGDKKADGDAKPAGDKKDDKPLDAGTKHAPIGAVPVRWTEATPDKMVDLAIDRAKAGGDDALAGLVVAASLDDRVAPGAVARLSNAVSRTNVFVADDARMLALELVPPPIGKAWDGWAKVKYDAPASRTGIVQTFAIVGPFQDTGGNLTRAEGPEGSGHSITDASATYSWGVWEVAVRRTLPDTATALGLPLDLYVSPRQEVCTYLATKVTFAAGQTAPVTVHVASTGSLRVAWDGVNVGVDENVHRRAVFDRMAARIQPDAGAHVLTLKVCSGTQGDEGRVRVRFTDSAGKPFAADTSSDLSGVDPDKVKPHEDTSPRFERVTTPLEEALDLSSTEGGKSPSLEHALAGAVVRTLAGADDLRSPRAPGLLERVARDPSVTADQLALAAWLSAFGSNRSGWMNDARTKAASSGDTVTEAFAQRRVAEMQYQTGRDDWALATLDAEPFKSATDLEAKVMRREASYRVGGSLERTQALDELLALDKSEKGNLPLWVVRQIPMLAGDKPEVAAMYAERIADKTWSRGSTALRAASLVDAASVEKRIAQLVTWQSNAGTLVSFGRTLLDLGRHEWAREILFTATQLSPNNYDAFDALGAAREAVLHDEVAQGKPPTDDAEFARAAEQRALDLRPTDTRQKDEIEFRSRVGEQTEGPTEKTPQDDEKYLTPSAEILARAKANPAKVGEVFERQLHFMRVVTYHDDKRVSQLIHYAREIVVEPRTTDELYEAGIPVEGDEAELVFARLWHADGTMVAPDEQSSGGSPYIKWPELKRGDVVEVAVRGWTSSPVGRRGDAPFYFIDYVGSSDTRPVLFNAVIVDSPPPSDAGALYVDVVNGKADRVENSDANGRKVVKLIWDHPPSMPEEPLAPQTTEILPIVVGSTYHGWGEFREWYRSAIKGFSEPDEEVKQLAKDLTKDKKTEKEKLEAIFNFVADDIRYVNYVSGEWWLPNRPQQLLARRQGDCDDKATLLISLLKSIGIEATPVLVQTRLTGQPSVLASLEVAVPMFDHGIAFIPGKKKGDPGMWLDATSPQSRIGPLPSMDARARALFIYEGDAKIIETPPSAPDDNGNDVEWTVKLDKDGKATLTAKEKHVGDWAFELRNYLIEEDARKQWIENYLTSRWLSAVTVGDKIDYVPDQGTLGYSAVSDGFARREGDELAIAIGGQWSYTSAFAPLTKRTLPVSLPPNFAPSHQGRTMTITAPDGYVFAEPPPDAEQKGGAFGSAKVTFKPSTDKKSMTVTTRIVIDKSIIPVAEYDAFRTWLQSIDGMMRGQVRLVPASRAPADANKK